MNPMQDQRCLLSLKKERYQCAMHSKRLKSIINQKIHHTLCHSDLRPTHPLLYDPPKLDHTLTMMQPQLSHIARTNCAF